ncbi:two-component sensor histidine kinase [Micromonospora sonchi]|uniref:histidine kinase n=1 Tax=Micromonospora sonchi TaxID=1763543 RepID=A0A917TF10_9ACTN|nr:sensor histidine kinase [Micromonospora sonchi]GGM19805.1 two-component sensor histidine kinase [Micromonospora sonchi]
MAHVLGSWRRVRRDALLAAGACLLDLVLFSHVLKNPNQPDEALSPLALSLVVAYAMAGYAVLCWRRRAPVAVFTIMLLHSLAAVVLPDYRPTVGLLVALYTVAAQRNGRVVPAALAGGLIASFGPVANDVANAAEPLREATAVAVGLFFLVVNLGVWTAGRWVYASRQQMEYLEYRRQVEAREAVNAERTRIARELHDIVAHAVTVMILHAAGAKSILASDPERAAGALSAIDEQGRQAMAELRRLLTVLRAVDDAAPVDGQDATADVPGLSNMDGLVVAARHAGMVVRVETEGVPRQLDRGVDLTAYRVVQEALTNATRHAGPGSTVDVRVRWQPDQLTIEVTDDGRGRPRPGVQALSTGHGLLGLRERVAVVDGQLTAEPTGSGYRVAVTLPTGTPAHGHEAGILPRATTGLAGGSV